MEMRLIPHHELQLIDAMKFPRLCNVVNPGVLGRMEMPGPG
jgi:hypothetical protein